MSGVLFIICIPREHYENCLKGNNKDNANHGEARKSTLNQQESICGSSGSSNSKETDTYAVSFETDSLNIRDDEHENKKLSERKSLVRDGSFDDEIFVDNNTKDEPTTSASATKDGREIIGSMDSDDFDRNMKKLEFSRENEAAVEKFFNAAITEKPPIDKSTPMEKVLREIIERMRIRNASWQRMNGGNSFKISFSIEKGIRCDDTIHMLSEFGIGQKEGSSIAIVPCTLYNDKTRLKEDDESSTSTQAMFKETSWNRFIGSVRARMNVAKTVEAVKSDAALSFDFIVLIIVASILAAFGLVENNSLFLAASMLISPLMGPILAATFGSVIKDRKLHYWGLANELIGIGICILVGFIFGILICGMEYGFGDTKQLTAEMASRTEFHSVIVGIFIAIVSGAAVAIAVLSENFGSLVGTAISASLLPPAVNTGLLWAYSLIHAIFRASESEKFMKFLENLKYSQNQSLELLILGTISLCMTITNVICVYLVGKILIRIKIEVAPVLSDEERQFWKHDVPIARDYNKTLNAEEGKVLSDELAEFMGHESENFRGVGAELLRQEFYPQTHTWSPLNYHHRYGYRADAPNKTSLKDVFQTITGNFPNDNHKHTEFINIVSNAKASDPIPTPKASTSDHFKFNSAPLESINELIQRRTTFVDMKFNSTDEANSPGGDRVIRKFVVTKAQEPEPEPFV